MVNTLKKMPQTNAERQKAYRQRIKDNQKELNFLRQYAIVANDTITMLNATLANLLENLNERENRRIG